MKKTFGEVEVGELFHIPIPGREDDVFIKMIRSEPDTIFKYTARCIFSPVKRSYIGLNNLITDDNPVDTCTITILDTVRK